MQPLVPLGVGFPPEGSSEIFNPHNAFSGHILASMDSIPEAISTPDPMDEAEATEVLSCLLESIEVTLKLSRRFYELSLTRMMPWCFVWEAFTSLQSNLSHMNANRGNAAAEILGRTLKPFVVPPDTSAIDFPKLFTGPNLRLETVGILLTTAALAASRIPHSDTVILRYLPIRAERKSFAAGLLAASDKCVALCSKYLVANDMMTWLRIEYQGLTGDIYGNSSRFDAQSAYSSLYADPSFRSTVLVPKWPASQ